MKFNSVPVAFGTQYPHFRPAGEYLMAFSIRFAKTLLNGVFIGGNVAVVQIAPHPG